MNIPQNLTTLTLEQKEYCIQVQSKFDNRRIKTHRKVIDGQISILCNKKKMTDREIIAYDNLRIQAGILDEAVQRKLK